MLKSTVIVGLGSFIGGAARYGVGLIPFLKNSNFMPLPTLFVNLLGSFLIGVFARVIGNNQGSDNLYLFAITGLMGGFTTFSAFSFETLNLLRSGAIFTAVAYITLTVVVGTLCCYWGLSLNIAGE